MINSNHAIPGLKLDKNANGINNKKYKLISKSSRANLIPGHNKSIKRGIGLGLRICSDLVRGLCPVGKILVESKVDVGSKFSFNISNISTKTKGVKFRRLSIFNEEILQVLPFSDNCSSILNVFSNSSKHVSSNTQHS